ncbi:hypothetical protein BV25DRAFT_1811333 [Artomyces pyxidatus]|uniref:Uncharacterized protein n=1 Tax=Artomyces pyxidatus TaxID=48021 RepID=A0ACB8SQD1_9AGAM|nr:hypothetical protein BV25DRAFT_1811333 [Artomyces pyxidatus]
MPVELKGSCHCGTVKFTVQSSTPVPYQVCLCSICRKVGGVGGSINLGAHADTLQITEGKEHISIYNAVLNRGQANQSIATSERHFCSKCSAMLWLWDETWPELLHPFASAIDSPELKDPEEMVICLLTNSKPDYVRLPGGKTKTYTGYPPLSIEEWHKEHGEYIP